MTITYSRDTYLVALGAVLHSENLTFDAVTNCNLACSGEISCFRRDEMYGIANIHARWRHWKSMKMRMMTRVLGIKSCEEA